MSSPAPLLRPPIPGARSQSGSRTPRLGLAIPPSPHARPVVNGASDSQGPSRPAPPQLRLATPMGTSHTPHEGRPHPRGLPPLQIGTGLSAASSDASAHSRSGSFGETQVNGSTSAASSYSALPFPGLPLQRPSQGSDPISAISQGGSDMAQSMERENSMQALPDLDQMAADKGAPLDVEDLDDLGWKAAGCKGLIEERGGLGEGAGGAVTKCVLRGGKTIFALKVPGSCFCAMVSADLSIDNNHKSRRNRQKTNSSRDLIQQELRQRPHLPLFWCLSR